MEKIVTKYIRKQDLVHSDMDGEVVMMSIDQGKYFGIGGTGNRIWDALEQHQTTEQLVEIICSEYQVDPGTATRDVQAFLNRLLESELISHAQN